MVHVFHGSPMLSLFKLVGIAACLKSTAHFCVIWQGPQVSCRKPPFWKKKVPKLIPKSCADSMPKSTLVASLLHVVLYSISFGPPLKFHFDNLIYETVPFVFVVDFSIFLLRQVPKSILWHSLPACLLDSESSMLLLLNAFAEHFV